MSDYDFKVGEHIRQTRPWSGNAKNAQLDTVWRVTEILSDSTGKPRVYVVIDTGNTRARGRTMAPTALVQGRFVRVPAPIQTRVVPAVSDESIEERVTRLERLCDSVLRSTQHLVTAIERVDAQREAAE